MYSYTELQSKFNRSTNPNKREYKLENNTYVIKANLTQDYFVILLHGSQIAVITQDKIILDSCGWRTPTTKDRMNHVLQDNRVSYRIYQKHYKWYVWYCYQVKHTENLVSNESEFYNGITFIYETSPLMGIGWRLNTE